jgi:hypothetical protein
MLQIITTTLARYQRNSLKLIFGLLLTTLLSGCATKVEVVGNFPKPIVNQLPLTLGVYYPPLFSNYRYIETNDDRGDRSIGIGNAQRSLFNTVLPALFKQVVTVDTVTNPSSAQPLDLVITMTVDDFQYTVPAETKIDMYEVWVKYNMQLFDPQGQLIADWILTAYGKSPSEMMKGEGESLNQAMIVALRDAGAGFALSFKKVPEIRQWLAQRQKSQI